MPAKSMCPNCGQKWRSPAHLCHPTRVAKMQRKRAAVAAATAASAARK